MTHKKHHKEIALYSVEATGLVSLPYKNLDSIAEIYRTDKQFWIDIIGDDKNQITQICNFFGIHQSIIKDILHLRDQRPKAECLDSYV